jgi:hypothetical protein
MWIKAAAAAPCHAAQQQQQQQHLSNGSSSSSEVSDMHWLPLLSQSAGAIVDKSPSPSVSTAGAAGTDESSRDCGSSSSLAVAVGAAGRAVHGLLRVTVKVSWLLLLPLLPAGILCCELA